MRAPLIDEAGTKRAIRDKIIELARRRGIDAADLKDSAVIPETVGLDSAGVLELILWYEVTFDVSIPQEDLTLENFGTVDSMTSYLQRA